MAYFKDLITYEYFPEHRHSGTRNVGWLERCHDFERMLPSESILDSLWHFCTVSVVQTRGLHFCDLCEPGALVSAERNGLSLSLGSSEIRVFSERGEICAAPTLIYHYVNTHHYKPPDIFLRSLKEGLTPPTPEYFEKLNQIGLEWEWTHRQDPTAKHRKLIKHDGRLELKDVKIPKYHDSDCKARD